MSVWKPKNSPLYRFDFWLGGHRFHGPTECTTRKEARAVEAVEREKAKAQVKAMKRSRASLLIDDVAARLWSESGQFDADPAATSTNIKVPNEAPRSRLHHRPSSRSQNSRRSFQIFEPAATTRWKRRSPPMRRTAPSRRARVLQLRPRSVLVLPTAPARWSRLRPRPDRSRSTAKAPIGVLGRTLAPHRHAGAGSAADADTRARGSRGHDEEQAGAVVELVAAGRGLSCGEITGCHSGMVRRTRPESRDSGFDAAHRPGMTLRVIPPTPRSRSQPRASASPTAPPRRGCCPLPSRQSRIAATARADREPRISTPLPAAA
jgi:hypothetical protein